ncbi:flagellar hook-length control protein FliK [Desulfovibrio sp. UIB00]|uniref:flagellar hook-length control protein FliK n=1 Tax=Desulfovibrio sp. UIB00 TaxID=2804314 RepID=UPI001F108AE0|nr:flagellar hook-length control protein FliK [Desulfovibrio sp. UIB00]MCH5146029.1 flagellar hook-length control protein FliK [Desulfovibrio sp. UIB00]
MQIIPTSVSTNETLWNAANNNRPNDERTSSFMDALNSSLKAVEQADASADVFGDKSESKPSTPFTPTARAAAQVQSPYSRNTSNGVTYTLNEVCFTKQEVQDMHSKLIKAGATPESLVKLAALAEMPDGATLAQITASVKGGGDIPVLTDEDKANITSLLKKIDPTGVLDTNVQAMMLQGNTQQAFNTISAFVNKLDPAGTLEVSQGEAISLGRGLGLGTANLQTLANSFGNSASVTCLNEQFGTLMAPVTDFFTTQAAAQKTLDTALKTTLQPIISKARARTEKEKQASSLRDRTVQQSKTLIDKTVQKKSSNILGETLEAGQKAEPGDIKIAAQSEAIGKDTTAAKHEDDRSIAENKATATQRMPAERTAGSTAAQQSNTQAAQQSGSQAVSRASVQAEPQTGTQAGTQLSPNTPANQIHAQSATQQATALDDKGQKNTESNSGQGESDKDQKGKSAWGDLLGKVDTQSAAVAARGSTPAYAAAQAMQAAHTAQSTTDVQDPSSVAPIGRQVAQQVEQGMLSTVKGGGTRLDLQLNPQELGSITVSLSVRNGEVSAVIRSEKSETNDMIGRQVDAIRMNLEQQGLKVDKLEVRQETRQEQNSASWQDFSQHNSRQEEDARREELSRLKNLATVRNSSSNMNISTLEQPVHSLGNTARYTTSNLNVVA